MSAHDEVLNKLCRICGSIWSERADKFLKVEDFKIDLDATFGIKTVDDVASIHPVHFCLKCFYNVSNFKKRKSICTLKAITWSSHQLENCETCMLASVKVVGGRPKKKKTSGRPKQVKTLDDIMKLDPSKPIPASVERALSHVVGIKMDQSHLINKSVQFSTGGPQPLTLTPVQVPRKKSHSVSKRTLRNRTNLSKDIIQLIAGDNEEAFSVQATNIVGSFDEITRKKVIDKLKVTTTIPAEHVAAMKATQNIPWNLLVEVRRWLATFNVKLSTKNKVREVAKEWVGKGLKCEYAPLIVTTKKRREVKPVPWCYLYNFVGHVIARLNSLNECNLLVSHKFIPDDEVHVKIGGDHGGGSFKMTYQIANVNNPNKLDNTVIFSIFEAKDTRANLRLCLERFRAHIAKLQTLTWSDSKKFRLFMFGDYEFLSSMYGISGAAGRHPCLWCEVTSEQMQHPKFVRENSMPSKRTLQNLQQHHDAFMYKCNNKLSLAKTVYNVMDDIFFEIPLDQVCLPGLHITLGIYFKIFNDIIERYCAELDNKINNDNCYHEIKKIKNDVTELLARRELVQNEIDWHLVKHNDVDVSDYKSLLEDVEKEISEKEKLLMDMDYRSSTDDNGPCVDSLDGTLKEIGVVRQAYYSNSITGNHCHILLKEMNIIKLCDSIPIIVLSQVGETALYRDSLIKFEKIKMLLTLYSKCDAIFNVARYLKDDEILNFQQVVNEFMCYLREHFPDINISPKLHMLEDHMFDFLWKWKTGCGLYGEQGVESAHNGINKMKHRYTNVKNNLNRLEYIMNQHLLSTNPKVQVIRPKKRTRNLKI